VEGIGDAVDGLSFLRFERDDTQLGLRSLYFEAGRGGGEAEKGVDWIR